MNDVILNNSAIRKFLESYDEVMFYNSNLDYSCANEQIDLRFHEWQKYYIITIRDW